MAFTDIINSRRNIPGILTAGIDPLGAIDPIAANSSKPAKEPCDGNGCVLQLRKVSELSMEPNRSRDLYWSSDNFLKIINKIHIYVTVCFRNAHES